MILTFSEDLYKEEIAAIEEIDNSVLGPFDQRKAKKDTAFRFLT